MPLENIFYIAKCIIPCGGAEISTKKFSRGWKREEWSSALIYSDFRLDKIHYGYATKEEGRRKKVYICGYRTPTQNERPE
ncbi:MAG: hypothetical protein KME60_00495 [Cyanomargarita calcarea GSE-NOS-MK-12-04C]|uniref:Uncharacterized protein n=1 Tax=Cyanomargarita calcarea GSE-NOS-MK-12-04C TaxID=2839659 RepID=A0A951USL1_9CYAN|nr:hypothetical protein [Cyanomargarita calcarea GSE-NOS-MK-12-04C]